MLIANTKKYLQSDWVRGAQYWLYLYSVFSICSLSLNNNNNNNNNDNNNNNNKKESTFDFRSRKIEMYSLKTN